jgi:hypothetical protein
MPNVADAFSAAADLAARDAMLRFPVDRFAYLEIATFFDFFSKILARVTCSAEFRSVWNNFSPAFCLRTHPCRHSSIAVMRSGRIVIALVLLVLCLLDFTLAQVQVKDPYRVCYIIFVFAAC